MLSAEAGGGESFVLRFGVQSTPIVPLIMVTLWMVKCKTRVSDHERPPGIYTYRLLLLRTAKP